MSRAPVPPAVRTPKRATPNDRIPRRVMQPTLNDHLEIVTRAIFQAGLSWALIAARWDAFRVAFDGFAVERVAAYGDSDIDRLLAAEGVIHSRKKLVGTVANARALLAIVAEFGGVEAYLASFPAYAAVAADAHRRFAYLGDLGCYYWLFRTGHAVPPFETWLATQPKDHPRMREMVFAGRAEATSSEQAGY